MRELKYGFSYS